MKVFVSSAVTGFEEYRAAVRVAVDVLRHETILAERYPAMAGSPQQACLQGVRDADVTVVVLGARYGQLQPSGMSATHEEFLEAHGRGVAIVLVQEGIDLEPEQASLIKQVKTWTGSMIETFTTPEQLKEATIRALNRFEVSRSQSRVDAEDLLQKALKLIPSSGSGASPAIAVAIVPGPKGQLIRPAQLDSFGAQVRREVLTGQEALFDPALGTRLDIREDRVVLVQDQRPAMVAIDASGTFASLQPALGQRGLHSGVLAIIEEDIQDRIQNAIDLANRLLDQLDPVRRATDVVIVAGLVGGSWLPWRTRAEHLASPNSASMGRGALSGGQSTVLAYLTPARRPRGDLAHASTQIAEDLTVLLRRQIRI
jgi:hypothetical protein